MKPAAFIFDIDNTIADTSDRIHLIKPPEGQKKNWGKFFKDSIQDKPFNHTKRLYEALRHVGGYQIYFVTARPENNRKLTLDWLDKNHFDHYHGLFMRPDNERKADFEVKRDIYREHFKDKIEVIAAFEDRLQVAKMWREEGVPVLLCGDEWLEQDWSK